MYLLISHPVHLFNSSKYIIIIKSKLFVCTDVCRCGNLCANNINFLLNFQTHWPVLTKLSKNVSLSPMRKLLFNALPKTLNHASKPAMKSTEIPMIVLAYPKIFAPQKKSLIRKSQRSGNVKTLYTQIAALKYQKKLVLRIPTYGFQQLSDKKSLSKCVDL